MTSLVRRRLVRGLALAALLSFPGPEARSDQEERWNVDLVGRWIGGPSHAVAVRDSIAYASLPGGLVIVDLTTPDAPVELGSVALPGDCYLAQPCARLVLSGPHAYVSAGSAGLRIIDISDPSAPFEAGSFDADGFTTDVDVRGGHAYVADFDAGLRIIDVANPTTPQEAGFFPAVRIYGVTVDGDHAYLTGLNIGLRVIDVSDPSAPVEVGSYGAGHESWGVAVAGPYAFVAYARDGIRIVDISDPSNPIGVGALDTRIEAFDVAVDGNRLYVADTGYFVLIDVTDPSSPVLRSALRSSVGLVYDVAVSDGLVYLTVGSRGLRVLDVSDASRPEIVGGYDSGDFTRRIAIHGDYAFAAGSNDGIRILDVSDPGRPVVAGLHQAPAGDIAIDGDHAFVIGGGALRVLDVSQPLAPVEVGACTIGSSFGIDVRDGYAYVANGFDGLRVLDVSNPSLPFEAALLDTPGYAYEVVLDGDFCYVADRAGGLRIVDVSDPTAPLEVGSYATEADAVGVAAQGGVAYVSVFDSGLAVVDVSDPTAPVKIGVFDKGESWTAQVIVSGETLFLTYEPLGLRVLDVSEPGNPLEVGFFDTSGRAVGVTLDDGLAYVAGGANGVYVMRYRPPRAVRQLDVKPGACPNPLDAGPSVEDRSIVTPSQGVLPVALLGEADFDVADVDPSSVRLEGVPALRHDYEDVSSVRSDPGDCACPIASADGYADLTLLFNRADVLETIGQATGSVSITLVGTMNDGTEFEATDCVQIGR